MAAIMMTVESVRTRSSTGEALLTLSVPLEQAGVISEFLKRIGQQVGVAFADIGGAAIAGELEKESGWSKLPPLTQSAINVCKEPLFQSFVVEVGGNPFDEPSETKASEYVKTFCKVSSRKDLATADGARERFGDLMARFRAWQERDGRRAHRAG